MGAGPREKVLDWAGLAGLSAVLGLGRRFGLGLGPGQVFYLPFSFLFLFLSPQLKII